MEVYNPHRFGGDAGLKASLSHVLNVCNPVVFSFFSLGLSFMPSSISAKAFIHKKGRFLLQHRDRDQNIWHPGCWGLFGGEIEQWETPVCGLLRELKEELSWEAKAPEHLLTWNPRAGIVIHIFLVQLDLPISRLKLNEGAGMDWVDWEGMHRLELTPEISENLAILRNLIHL